MKKTLSIILCLSLLVSTYSFAIPAFAADMTSIGIESAEEFDTTEKAENSGVAGLAADTNIFNFDFESAQNPFVGESNVVMAIEGDETGHYLKVEQNARGKQIKYTSDTGLTPGKYVLSYDVYIGSLTDKGTTVTSWKYCTSGTHSSSTVEVSGIPAETWNTYTYEFTIDSTTANYVLNMYCGGAGLRYAKYSYIDNIKLVKKPEPCTLKYNANGGVFDTAPADVSAMTGDVVTLAGSDVVSREHYIFKGWATNSDAVKGISEYTPDRADFASDTSEITLYAVWEAITYDVVFDGNNADFTSFESPLTFREVDGDQTIKMPVKSAATRGGYLLAGWNDGTTTYDTGSEVVVSGATTFTAVWKSLSDYGSIKPVSQKPEYEAINVDMRYPVAYYTFNKDVSASDVTLENLNNPTAGGVYYDADNKTIWVFPDAKNASAGATITFPAWDSYIPTADGKDLLSFTAAKFTLASAMSDDGENLTPFANVEYGWNPFYADSDNTRIELATEDDGNHASFLRFTGTATNQVWIYTMHNFTFKPNTTYKIDADVKFGGFSLPGIASGTGMGVFANTQYSSGDTIDHQDGFSHNAANATVKESDGWVHLSKEQKIRNIVNSDHNVMSFYSNPPSAGGAAMYYVDNLTIYEKVGNFFISGPFTTLTGTAPETIYGYNGDEITLPAEMPYTVKDDRWTINGWTDGTNTYALGETINVSGKKTFTPNLETTYNTHSVKFASDFVCELPLNMTAIDGDEIDLTSDEYLPTDVNTYNFIGWSTDGTKENIVKTLTVDKDYNLTAMFELTYEIIFDNERTCKRQGLNLATSEFDADKKEIVIIPSSPTADAYITTQALKINASEYDTCEITFDATRGGNDNKFTEDMNENMLYFAYPESSYSWAGDRGVSGIFKGYEDEEHTKITYTYNLSANGNWKNTIGRFRIDPYNGAPNWGVYSIKLIKNNPIENVELTDITAPSLRAIPDTTAKVPTDAKYTAGEVTWSPAYNGHFSGDVAYKATVVLSRTSGYSFSSDTKATIDGFDAETVYDGVAGTLTVSYTFPKTEPFVDVNVEITGGNLINVPDGTLKLTGKVTTVNPADKIDSTKVLWSVDRTDLCSISDSGVLTAFYDGVVTVTAASDYNPSKKATVTVTITNQVASYKISFNSATKADVKNMPDPTTGKREFTFPEKIPTRDGFIFAGWRTTPDGAEVVTEPFISGDTTFYALWAQGTAIYDFNTTSHGLSGYSGVSNLSVNTDEGVLEFTNNNADPMLRILPRCDASLYKKIEIRFATDAKSGTYSAYFTSKDANGNYIGWPWENDNQAHKDQYAANHVSVNYTSEGIDKFQTVTLDFSSFSDWQGYIEEIRMDPIEQNIGAKFKIDYVRLVNYANEYYDITDVVAPVAKAEAQNTAKSADVSKYVVKSVSWNPMLLHDYYFDRDTAYTVQVVVGASAGWALSNNPFVSTINGNDANYTLNNDGTATISYTFPATEHPESMDVTDLTLVEQNNDGIVERVRKVFIGSSLNIESYPPASVPYGMRWIGWSETENDTENILGTLDFGTEPFTAYALYEPLSEFDFSKPFHKVGVALNTTAAELTYDGNFAVVTPGATNQDVYLLTPELGVSAVDYGAIEVIYDGERMGVYDKKEYINKFNTSFKPILFYTLISAPDTYVSNSPVKAEKLIIDGKTCYKYTYNMNASASWAGLVNTLRVDPYNGYPAWAVRSIKMIPNTESNETVKIYDLNAPATWETPDTTAKVQTGYKVQSVTWTPASNEYGCFKPETVYTAAVVVKPDAGTKFADDTLATVNGKNAEVSINPDTGVMTVTYTFDATEALKETHVSISGDKAIIKDGRYSQYTGATVANDGSVIPYTDVIWSIRNEDTSNKNVLATITDKGRVFPILNGNVVVTATSIYDPSVVGEYVVEISGQNDKFEVKFDKNTADTVTGMPETDYAKGDYTPAEPAREGYNFAGWAKTDAESSGNYTVNITGATTLYAVWTKGMSYEFNTAGNAEGFSNANCTSVVKDGCIEVTPTSGDPFITKSGLSFSASEYKTVQIKLSATAASNLQLFFSYKDAAGAPHGVSEANSKVIGFPAATDGEFTILNFDMSTNSNWKDTITELRVDTGSIKDNLIKIDYIKILSSARKLTLVGNGGIIPVGGRQYESYTTNQSIGSVKLGYVPMRDGYKFMGWSKSADSMEKLYTGTITLVDDTTLYAMWNPTATLNNLDDATLDKLFLGTSEDDLDAMTVSSTNDGVVMKSATTAVNPVIRVADSMETSDNTKTILVNAKFAYKNYTNNKLALRFKPEGSDEYKTVTIASNLSKETSGFDYFSCDLSSVPEFTGNVTDVDLLLQGGTFTLYTLGEVTFTDEATAETIIKNSNTSTGGGTTGGSSSGGDDSGRKQYPIQEPVKDDKPVVSNDPIVLKSQSKDTITFDFDEESDEKLISSFRSMSKVSRADSILTLQSNGFEAGKKDSPAFFTPATLQLDAASHRYVVMRVKSEITPDPTIRVYFRTADAGFAEAKALSMKATDEYSIVAFDMSKVADWKGTITGFFFSMSGDAKGLLSIDYIMFSNTIPEEKVVNNFPYVNEFTSSTFSDVKSSDWFYGDVEKSYKMGFMNGIGDGVFGPDGSVTLAQAITVAARINAIYNEATIPAVKDGEEWYTPYVNYAVSKKIIKKTQFADVTVNATRSQVAQIFYASMTEDWFKPINVFNSVPDVASTDAGKKAILGLYNSGVVVGVDDEYNFKPDTEIKRSELSAIINRVALKDSRKRVITQDEIDSKKLSFTGDDLVAVSLGNCTANTPKLANGVITGTGKANDAGRADPNVYIGGVIGKINGGDYKTIRVKMKWNTSDIAKPGPVIFFTTPNGSWAAERAIYSTWDGQFDDDGFATFVFNCSSNGQWTGEITNMRFDPFDAAFDFSIASIDLIP